MRLFYDDLCKHYLIFSILCRPFRFGSSILSVWFRKHAARAASNSHVCLAELGKKIVVLHLLYKTQGVYIFLGVLKCVLHYSGER